MLATVKRSILNDEMYIIVAVLMAVGHPACADGEVILGYNATIQESRTKSAQAVKSALVQLGGSTNALVNVLGMATNMAGINSAVSNKVIGVSGTIDNLQTTGLGAVNTGYIQLRVNMVVYGIIGQPDPAQ